MARRKQQTWRVSQIVDVLERIAPPELAQEWDNVGLVAGDPHARCQGVLLCIDLTQTVLSEAISAGVGLIAAYHPPIFKPILRLRADAKGPEAAVFAAVRKGLAVYCMHTALDAADGGTNDVLAALCGLKDPRPFGPATTGPLQYKVVVFVPAAYAERVADAAFAAGAGRIGQYQCCSFRVAGQGTFRGGEQTRPAVGRPGRLERVDELRLEFVSATSCSSDVIEAVRRAHPYEEPAIDLYKLEPTRAVGIGRLGSLGSPVSLGGLAKKLKMATGIQRVCIVGRPARKLRRAAVCAGSTGQMPLDSAAVQACDVIVTGELRHHDALALERAGLAVIALGHWASERPALAAVARRLTTELTGLKVRISAADRCPLQPV